MKQRFSIHPQVVKSSVFWDITLCSQSTFWRNMPPPSLRSKSKLSKKPHILHSGLRPTCRRDIFGVGEVGHGVQGVGVTRPTGVCFLLQFRVVIIKKSPCLNLDMSITAVSVSQSVSSSCKVGFVVGFEVLTVVVLTGLIAFMWCFMRISSSEQFAVVIEAHRSVGN
jgi:hypothetical protein